jgi:hypothetical protein
MAARLWENSSPPVALLYENEYTVFISQVRFFGKKELELTRSEREKDF